MLIQFYTIEWWWQHQIQFLTNSNSIKTNSILTSILCIYILMAYCNCERFRFVEVNEVNENMTVPKLHGNNTHEKMVMEPRGFSLFRSRFHSHGFVFFTNISCVECSRKSGAYAKKQMTCSSESVVQIDTHTHTYIPYTRSFEHLLDFVWQK